MRGHGPSSKASRAARTAALTSSGPACATAAADSGPATRIVRPSHAVRQTPSISTVSDRSVSSERLPRAFMVLFRSLEACRRRARAGSVSDAPELSQASAKGLPGSTGPVHFVQSNADGMSRLRDGRGQVVSRRYDALGLHGQSGEDVDAGQPAARLDPCLVAEHAVIAQLSAGEAFGAHVAAGAEHGVGDLRPGADDRVVPADGPPHPGARADVHSVADVAALEVDSRAELHIPADPGVRPDAHDAFRDHGLQGPAAVRVDQFQGAGMDP